MQAETRERRKKNSTGGEEGARTKVAVCVATCRRPSYLARTLESLASQSFERAPSLDVSLFVVENDNERQGEPVVREMESRFDWDVNYEVEPVRGITYARNRLVSMTGDADYIVFIDDDEIAEPGWLDELVAVAEETGADAVLGPVRPLFEAPVPDWLAPMYDRPRHPDGSIVTSKDFRTGNVILRKDTLRNLEGPFDHAFALTGGEDGHLGRVLEQRGARYAWADRAVVQEHIPASRIGTGWLLKRKFRNGVGMSIARRDLLGRRRASLETLVRGSAAVCYGALGLGRVVTRGRGGAVSGALDIAYGVGSLLGLAGVKYHEYRRIHGE